MRPWKLSASALTATLYLIGLPATAEKQMVAQMACQQEGFDGPLPRVMVFTQAELKPAFTNAVVPKVDESVNLADIPFKLQIYHFDGQLDLEGEVPAQIKELRTMTSPEPEFDFVSVGRKDDFRLGFLEDTETRNYHIVINLKPDFPKVSFIRPGKESFTFNCKRFYLTEYSGD